MATATKEKFTGTTTEDLAAQVDALKADIAALTQSLGDYGRTQSAHLAESARASGEAEYEHLRSKVADLGNQAEDFVVQKPGVALGIAAGIGFLAGLVISRR
jgi:ElaB/YqjD/DUF883 family membrane-anchored ribosome-binding protein